MMDDGLFFDRVRLMEYALGNFDKGAGHQRHVSRYA